MGARVAAIHQPNYLPWIGYFHKIHESDVFVYLDDVEFSTGSWINRNKLKTPDGWTWVTVPVRQSDVPIDEVEIADHEGWRDEHWKTLTHNYGGAEHFDEWRDLFESTYDEAWERLYPLNRHLIESIVDRLDVEMEFVEASAHGVDADGSERLAELCDAVDADTYLCGMGADEYMDESVFERRGVSVEYQDFDHPTYEQRFDGFEPAMSFVDAVLNVGAEQAREMLEIL